MLIHHRLLHRMEFAAVLVREVFHREQLLPVQGADEGDATVDRTICEGIALHLRHHHRTSAAISGSAALLGAALVPLLAQILQHGQIRPRLRQSDFFPIEQKTNHAKENSTERSAV